MTFSQQKRMSYYLLLAPGLLLFASIIIFPVFYSFSLSFTSFGGYGKPAFIGLENYAKIIGDEVFQHSLRNNLLIVAVSVFGQIPLGFLLAYLLHRKMVHGGNFYQTMIFLPITISPVVVALLWNQIFSSSGMVVAIIRNLTGQSQYVMKIFENKQMAIYPILFVLLWMHTGTYMIIFYANLQKMTPSLLEAAQIDGASESQMLGRIILPSMVGTIATTAIFAISGSLKAYDIIYSMTGGGPGYASENLNVLAFKYSFEYFRMGQSAVMLVFLFIIVLLFSLLVMRLRRAFEL